MNIVDLITAPEGNCGIIPGRNILKSEGFGDWLPEHVEALIKNLLKLSQKFGGKPFAYIADPSKMNPIIRKDTSAAFVQLHVELEKAGCRAIAFLDGNTAAMKLQSQKHQNLSESQEMQVLHFKTEEQALEWLEKMGL
ncbi:MAG: hypothetical protein GX271_11565 [Clostridiales bacterium]|jgi:hypothetical protein|nr:hypothetical protein [Clostridiales bacterium]